MALNSTTRTPDQTQTAIFWAYDRAGMGPPPVVFNQAVSEIATQHSNTTADNARLFAMTMVAQADASIAAWNSKFVADFWRPITAIREGDTDGNPLTEADTNWIPLGAPGAGSVPDFTPPFPAYVSGHATFGGAVFTTLANFYGTDDFDFTLTSGEMPGITRSFHSFSQASEENGRSRVYMGVHWNFDDVEGRRARGPNCQHGDAELFSGCAGAQYFSAELQLRYGSPLFGPQATASLGIRLGRAGRATLRLSAGLEVRTSIG